MDIEYIQKTVGKELSKAIASLVEIKLHQTKHPLDGIQFIGEYLVYQSKIESRIDDFNQQQKKVGMIQEQLKEERNEILYKMKQILDSLVVAVQAREERLENERLRKEKEEQLKLEQQLLAQQASAPSTDASVAEAGENVDDAVPSTEGESVEETPSQENNESTPEQQQANPPAEETSAPVAGGPAEAVQE